MTALITLTAAGQDSGPFKLYSDVDNFLFPFEQNISRASLLAGYTSVYVPDGATIVRVMSTGVCVNAIDIPIVFPTTTTTTTVGTTTTTTLPDTTTTTTTAGPVPFLLVYDGNYVSCSGQLSVFVNTQVPVKVKITGVFQSGGSWLNPANLIFSGTKISANLDEEIISTTKQYTYGIDGFTNGVNDNQSSSVTIQIADANTDVVIDSYTYTRAHTLNPC